tara:strand:+ start:1893 stop:4493 length:2601 start_codon:yes stop_codon:yes gene_type:complete
MDNSYNPSKTEDKIYSLWMENNAFSPSTIESGIEPFTIIMPPPNVTGELHMGHALTIAIEDLMIRWKRMKGHPSLYLPGSDHAGIATQVVVEKEIAKDGLNRHELGRDNFIKKVWDWVDDYGDRIYNQMQKMGASCDWSKKTFTLDEIPQLAVKTTFVNLYKKNLIYRGERITNWCSRCSTVLSDLEVKYKPEKSKLYYLKYFFKNSQNNYLTIATTRPETLLGDTAVAVNPNDSRFKKYIGGSIIIPIVNREVKIIGDSSVEMDFGTGALKVTPAHDHTDFDIGRNHNLEVINVFDKEGKGNENAIKYKGLKIEDIRSEIIKDLDEKNHIEKIDDYENNVSHCERCDNKVEPYISMQWFVKIKPLAEKAIQAIKDEEIIIIPKRFNKTYFDWMENIIDWCISRQLWWGHRIPAWFCKKCPHISVSVETPTKCEKCECDDIYQDPDVLDTWFSSGLWTHSTLGWPNKSEELQKFYPSTVMETGYDILFFWVARMIMLGIENMGKVPFSHIYLHGLILDPTGLKMSKSKGNVMNPLELIDEYGADALRFAITTGVTPGNNQRIDERKIESARNFANKIWNASRFSISKIPTQYSDNNKLGEYDLWILEKLKITTEKVNTSLEEFNFGEAQKELYEFFWNEFCDWYIELYKSDESNNSIKNLIYVLQTSLKLLHPFLPFMTEQIWQILNEKLPDKLNNFNSEKIIINSSYPCNIDAQTPDSNIEYLIKLIKSIRNLRSELRIEHNHTLKISIPHKNIYSSLSNYKKALENLCNTELTTTEVENNFPLAVDNNIFNIEIPNALNMSEEISRIESEIKDIKKRIIPLSKRLNSPDFFNNAPEEVVAKEKERLKHQENRISQLGEILKSIS